MSASEEELNGILRDMHRKLDTLLSSHAISGDLYDEITDMIPRRYNPAARLGKSVSSKSNASIRSVPSINSSPPTSPVPSISSPASYTSFASYPNFKTTSPLSAVPEKPVKDTQRSSWDEPEVNTSKYTSTQTPTKRNSTAPVTNKVQDDTANYVAAQAIKTQTTTTQANPNPPRKSATTSIPSSPTSSNSKSKSSWYRRQTPQKSQTMPISNSSSTIRNQTRNEPIGAQSVAAAAKSQRSASSSIPTFDRAATHVAAPAPPQNSFPLIAPSGRSGAQKAAQNNNSGKSKNTTSNILTGISLGAKFAKFVNDAVNNPMKAIPEGISLAGSTVQAINKVQSQNKTSTAQTSQKPASRPQQTQQNSRPQTQQSRPQTQQSRPQQQQSRPQTQQTRTHTQATTSQHHSNHHRPQNHHSQNQQNSFQQNSPLQNNFNQNSSGQMFGPSTQDSSTQDGVPSGGLVYPDEAYMDPTQLDPSLSLEEETGYSYQETTADNASFGDTNGDTGTNYDSGNDVPDTGYSNNGSVVDDNGYDDDMGYVDPSDPGYGDQDTGFDDSQSGFDGGFDLQQSGLLGSVDVGCDFSVGDSFGDTFSGIGDDY